MAKTPIEIGIAEDGEAFRKGLKADVIEPLEDAEEAITDLGKSKGPERLERELEVAQEQTKDLRKETRKTADEIAAAYRQSSAKAKDSFKGAGDAAEAFGDQSKAKFAEVASSFKGDMGSIQDLAQGTLGGIAGTLTGPFALAAGGAAIGVGLIGSAIQGLVADAEATKQRVGEKFKEMAQSGLDDWLSMQAVIARTDDILADHGDEVTKIADELNLPVETVLAAWAGMPHEMEVVKVKLSEMSAEVRDFAESMGQPSEIAEEMYLNLETSTKPLRDAMRETEGAVDRYEERARVVNMMLRNMLADAGNIKQEIDDVGNELYTLSDGQQVIIEADTKQATLNLDKFREDLDGIADTVVFTRAEIETPNVASVWNQLQHDLNGRGPLRVRAVADLGGVRVL